MFVELQDCAMFRFLGPVDQLLGASHGFSDLSSKIENTMILKLTNKERKSEMRVETD